MDARPAARTSPSPRARPAPGRARGGGDPRGSLFAALRRERVGSSPVRVGAALVVELAWPKGVNTNKLYMPRYDLRTRQILPGGRVLTVAARKWKERAVAAAQSAFARGMTAELARCIDGDLCVCIDVYEPNAIRRDVDNLAKLALDACFEALGRNDRRARRLEIERVGADAAAPCLVVLIEPYAPRRSWV